MYYYSIDTTDSLGSKIQISCNEGQIISKVSPVYDKIVNEEWISNKTRFYYDFLNKIDRKTSPILFYNNIYSNCFNKKILN